MSRRPTEVVRVGQIQIGGGAPVVVQAMTDTDTADAAATAEQCLALAAAGAELVRVTVNSQHAARAVPEIRDRLDDAGCGVPLIGDFHFNGHLLLASHSECARTLDKYRINPGNVGTAARRPANFSAICAIAREHGKPVRIGVNGGSLDPDLVARTMQDNTDRRLGMSSDEVINHCLVTSALESVEMALGCGLAENQIVVSCKTSSPRDLIWVYRELARRTRQPLHLGLTEAGIGARGLVWSAAAMGVLLAEGIGDTIRVSLTPRPGGDRREEVFAACELLQALAIRRFAPTVTSCPGCGRTASDSFQALAERVEGFVRDRMPEWRDRFEGVAELRLAVMGCVVNGPGESRSANIGISLPGTGESPLCPVYVDGRQAAVLQGSSDELAEGFFRMVEEYVASHYPPRVL